LDGASLGDPAEDLALVTGAAREPFQIASGLEKLLEAYALCGGSPVDAIGVRFHEVCMLARWYTEAQAGSLAYGRPDQLRTRIGNFVRRLPP
jgi:hypothetical protein